MNIRTIFPAVALTLFAVCSSASAQSYAIGYDQTSYTSAGEQVAVTLILSEDISGGGTSRLSDADRSDDLFSFNLSVDYSSFTGAANGSRFASLEFANGFVQSSDTTFTTTNDTGTVVSFESNVGLGDGVAGTAISASLFEVELATLIFDAGDNGSITTLQSGLTELTTGNPPLFFEDGGQPDIDEFRSGQIFVNAVPEPSSVAFIALLAGAGLIKRRRN